MTLTIFDHLNDLYTKKDINHFESLSDEDQKTYNVYMMNRLISMSQKYIPFVEMILHLKLTPSQHRRIFASILPKKKEYHKYIKGSKLTKYSTELLTCVSNKFNVSLAEAEEYCYTLYLLPNSKEILEELLISFGYTEKELKKLI